MDLQISGKIIKIQDETGVSKAGKEWKKRIVVIEYVEGTSVKQTAFEIFGEERIERFDIKQGDDVTIHFEVRSTEWNGRWFTVCNAYRIDPISTTSFGTETPQSTQPVDDFTPSGDDLPF